MEIGQCLESLVAVDTKIRTIKIASQWKLDIARNHWLLSMERQSGTKTKLDSKLPVQASKQIVTVRQNVIASRTLLVDILTESEQN